MGFTLGKRGETLCELGDKPEGLADLSSARALLQEAVALKFQDYVQVLAQVEELLAKHGG